MNAHLPVVVRLARGAFYGGSLIIPLLEGLQEGGGVETLPLDYDAMYAKVGLRNANLDHYAQLARDGWDSNRYNVGFAHSSGDIVLTRSGKPFDHRISFAGWNLPPDLSQELFLMASGVPQVMELVRGMRRQAESADDGCITVDLGFVAGMLLQGSLREFAEEVYQEGFAGRRQPFPLLADKVGYRLDARLRTAIVGSLDHSGPYRQMYGQFFGVADADIIVVDDLDHMPTREQWRNIGRRVRQEIDHGLVLQQLPTLAQRAEFQAQAMAAAQ